MDLGASDRGWELYSAKIYRPNAEDSAVSTFYISSPEPDSPESPMLPTRERSATPDPRQVSPPGITPSQRDYLGRSPRRPVSLSPWLNPALNLDLNLPINAFWRPDRDTSRDTLDFGPVLQYKDALKEAVADGPPGSQTIAALDAMEAGKASKSGQSGLSGTMVSLPQDDSFGDELAGGVTLTTADHARISDMLAGLYQPESPPDHRIGEAIEIRPRNRLSPEAAPFIPAEPSNKRANTTGVSTLQERLLQDSMSNLSFASNISLAEGDDGATGLNRLELGDLEEVMSTDTDQLVVDSLASARPRPPARGKRQKL